MSMSPFDLPKDPADWEPMDLLQALGFHDTGARLAINQDTGNIEMIGSLSSYKDSCGLYAWVDGGDVRYIGETESCLTSRMKSHVQRGATRDQLRNSRLTVEVWFSEEPQRRFTSASLSLLEGQPLCIESPDVLLVERFLITYGRDHDWDLWNLK